MPDVIIATPEFRPLPVLSDSRRRQRFVEVAVSNGAHRCLSCAAGNGGGDARGLSAFRYTNAEGFFRTVEERPEYPDIALYHAAISIELALSSYLLHVGFDDCWNCRNIRHDLDKALAYADQAGLGFISTELAWAVSILSPFYKRHGIDELARDPNCPISVIGAKRIVRCLLNAVRDAIGHRPSRTRKLQPSKVEAVHAGE